MINVTALNAQFQYSVNVESFSASNARLSSQSRINSSADDASGLAIATSLNVQSAGLSQAIKNATSAVSVISIADKALNETVAKLTTIKQKAIQAASDEQTLDSRKKIQADINKLVAQINNIARTTAYNGLKLLSGEFTNKQFQVGAYSGETVGVNIDSTEATKVGHLTTADLVVDQAAVGGETRLSIYSANQNVWVDIQSVKLAYDNSSNNSIGALANAINKVAVSTGVTAQAIVQSTSNAAVAAGSTGSDFAVNGVVVGAITVEANDANGALVNAINQKQSQTGVTASVDQAGFLTLKSDGRAIKVTGETGTTLMGSDFTTLGKIKLFQTGANEIRINDDADMVSLNTTAAITTGGDVNTIIDSTIAKDSTIISSSILQAGSTLGFVLAGSGLRQAAITTTQDSTILAGSVLASTSLIEANTILGGTARVEGDTTVDTESLLKAGSILESGAIFTAGTTLTTGINTTTGSLAAGTTIAADVTLSGDATFLADMLIQANSVIQSNSSLLAGSRIDKDLNLDNHMTLTQTMKLLAGSRIGGVAATNLLDGSTIGGAFTLSGDAVVTRDMLLKTGSVIESTSVLGKGSTIGGYTKIDSGGAATLGGDMTLAAGSVIGSASTIKAGTVLTDDIWGAGSILYQAGTVLTGDLTTSGTNRIDNSMTLKANSVLMSGSTLAPTASASTGASATTSIENLESYRLSDINVLSQEDAQVAISIVDATISAITKVKSDLGSSQNQLTSTIANLGTTNTNVLSASATITQINWAEESTTFSQMQVLKQVSQYALSQANADFQSVMRFFQ